MGGAAVGARTTHSTVPEGSTLLPGQPPPAASKHLTTMTSDEDLVARCRWRYRKLNQLVKRWERPIYALAYRTLGRDEDARDVTQETFLRAFRSIGGFRGQAKFSSWLYRIALNLCRDWLRKQRRAPVVQAPEGVDIIEMASEPDPGESIEDLVARQNLSRHVQRAMTAALRGAAQHHHPEGIPGADLSGNRRPAGMPPEHGQDAPLSGLTVLRRELDRQGIASLTGGRPSAARRLPPVTSPARTTRAYRLVPPLAEPTWHSSIHHR